MKCHQCGKPLKKNNKICSACGYDNSFENRLKDVKIPKELHHLSLAQLGSHMQWLHFLKEKQFWLMAFVVFLGGSLLFSIHWFFSNNKPETVHNYHDDIVDFTSVNASGNTNSNISNGGYLVPYGKSLYVSSDNQLYRVSLTLNEIEKIYDQPVMCLNVVNDTVYYIDVKNNNTVTILDLKTNKKIMTNYQASSLMVIGNYIYYLDLNHTKVIYQVKTDLTEERILTQSGCLSFNIIGDWLYYSTIDGLYRTPMMGGEVSKIMDGIYSSFIVSGQMIYYIDHEGDLYRMKMDGTKRTQLVDGILNSYLITDRYVIYGKYDGGIYKKNLETGELMQLSYEKAKNLQIAGSWIYYQQVDTNEGCFVSIDEKSNEVKPIFTIKNH